jgi:hypothetical protein
VTVHSQHISTDVGCVTGLKTKSVSFSNFEVIQILILRSQVFDRPVNEYGPKAEQENVSQIPCVILLG